MEGFGRMLLQVLFSDDLSGLVMAGMVPSRGHDQIKKFILKTGSFVNIPCEQVYFPEIGVQEAVLFHGSRNAVFNGNFFFLGLEGTEKKEIAIEYGIDRKSTRLNSSH